MRKLSPPVLGNVNVSHLEVWQLGHSRPQFFSRCFQHSENPANIIHEKLVCTRIIRRGLQFGVVSSLAISILDTLRQM